MKTDVELLKAALLGYDLLIANTDEKIRAIRQQLRGKPTEEPAIMGVKSTAKPKRHISEAGRERIAAAQRERWKKIHAVAKGKKKARTAA